jgi:hypothetical protein
VLTVFVLVFLLYVYCQSIEFLRKFRKEVEAAYTTPVDIPDLEYKKVVNEVEVEKTRLGLKEIKVEPPKKLSLKEAMES